MNQEVRDGPPLFFTVSKTDGYLGSWFFYHRIELPVKPFGLSEHTNPRFQQETSEPVNSYGHLKIRLKKPRYPADNTRRYQTARGYLLSEGL